MPAKRTRLLLLALLCLSVAGCGSPPIAPTPQSVAPTRPAREEPASVSNVTAKGKVVPAQKAQMGFLVPGPVKQVAVNEGDSVRNGQVLVALNAPDLEFAVIGAQAAVRSAQAEAEYWIYPRKGEPGERQKLARDRLVLARTKLESARAGLAQTVLVAPFDGTVVSLNAVSGQYLRPGQIAVVIGDLNQLQIETTDLSERDVPGVRIGQPVSVIIQALEGQFSGRVIDIARASSRTDGDVVYKVIIQLDEQPRGLLWGMSADVEIQIGD